MSRTTARRRPEVPGPGPSAARPARLAPAWLAAAIVALTLGVFAPVRHFAFVPWDDPLYVSENAVVRQGLTPGGAAWALTSPGQFYWHPLTWLSHMADVELFGMSPGPHHVTNVALHAAGALLLFLVLRAATGRSGPSALAAAAFAVHPLRVESVAWIAERKDVLSGVFWMLTIGAYAAYARRPSWRRYAAVAASFALGLMSKPTVVTLPLVLLLLDVWPLGRLAPAGAGRGQPLVRLAVEKLPLLALSAAASLVTFATELHVGAVQALSAVPLGQRLANAAVSAMRYLRVTAWPSGLAAFYPFRPVPAWQAAAAALALAVLTALAVRARRQRPYLMVGWLWYLVTLLPVIGLLQVGSQSMADRFTYLPSIGLAVAFAWGAADLVAALRLPRAAAVAAAVTAVLALGAAARVQAGYWKDGETLWTRAVEAVPNNDLAHANLGLVLSASGRRDEALAHFSEALRILRTPDPSRGTGLGTPPPEYEALLHRQAGLVLGQQGQWDRSAAHFAEAARLQPGDAEARHGLGQALAAAGRLDEALRESREAVRLSPDRAPLRADLALVLYRSGDRAGALAELQRALALEPSHPGAARWHYNLAAILNEAGRRDDALRELQAALARDPGYEDARRAAEQLRSPGR